MRHPTACGNQTCTVPFGLELARLGDPGTIFIEYAHIPGLPD